MVASDVAAERATTVGVSIQEDKNTLVEIPRYDPADKRKLWFSKTDIHHNTMMEKIRGLVQVQLLEQVASDDDFFKGIECIPIELSDEDNDEEGKPKTESDEEIILTKKAKILQDLLNAIMEMPKDDILDYLTTSKLPNGLNGSSKKSPGKKRKSAEPASIPISTSDTSGIDAAKRLDNEPNRFSNDKHTIDDNKMKQRPSNPQENNNGYNWILDCDDHWCDLPAVVRVNAIQLGYNETLWDEDAQDLPTFRTMWKKLTPIQRTAATFLGNYDEATWNDDVRILLLGGKSPSLASLTDNENENDDDDDDDDNEPTESFEDEPSEEVVDDESSRDANTTPISQKNPKNTSEEATVDTADTDTSGTQDQDDNDDNMLNEFVTNFVSDDEEEESDPHRDTKGQKKSKGRDAATKNSKEFDLDTSENSDAMMDEFLSNFDASSDEEHEDKNRKTGPKEEKLADKKKDTDEDSMMDEFLSNFGSSADEYKEETNNGPSPKSKDSVSQKSDEDEDEDAMMDEFLTNFGGLSEDSNDGDNKRLLEKESSPKTNNANSKNDEEEDAVMDEFLSNFVESEKEDVSSTDNVNNDSTKTETSNPPKNDFEEDIILSNFVDSAEEDMSDPKSSNENIIKNSAEKETSIPSTSAITKNDKEEEAMMDEFLSNFVDSVSEDVPENDVTDNSVTKEASFSTNNDVPKKDDEEEAMMDEFLANFGESSDTDGTDSQSRPETKTLLPLTTEILVSKEKKSDGKEATMTQFRSNVSKSNGAPKCNAMESSNPANESFVSRYGSVQDNIEDKTSDEEQPLVSKPSELSMERGIQGETSPLLPSSSSDTNIESQPEKPEPEPEPPSTWETISSYLYWIPVVVGLPVAYMVATKTHGGA